MDPRGQVLTPEALARHRVPSVASETVTSPAKRAQGGDGPQRARVKGLSPVMDVQCGCRRREQDGRPYRWSRAGSGFREPPGGRKPGHGTTAEAGTRASLWVLPRMGIGWHNRHPGRKPDGPEEVGCPQRSEEVGVVFQKWRWSLSYCSSKGIAVHKQAKDDVVHLGRF
jgi:hypothetical protein